MVRYSQRVFWPFSMESNASRLSYTEEEAATVLIDAGVSKLGIISFAVATWGHGWAW